MRTHHHTRSLEHGGIAAFIVIGLVVAGLFVGSVVLIKNRSNQIADNSTPGISEQQGQESADEQTDEQGTVPAPEPTDEEVSTPVTPAPDTEDPVSELPGDNSSEIAAAGPTETIAAMIGLGAIAAVMTRYLQSRAYLRQQ